VETPHFLTLPAEIRISIYKHLFRDAVVRIRMMPGEPKCPGPRCGRIYKSKGQSSYTSLLYANRQINSEAMPFFPQESEFLIAFEGCCADEEWCSGHLRRAMPSVSHISFTAHGDYRPAKELRFMHALAQRYHWSRSWLRGLAILDPTVVWTKGKSDHGVLAVAALIRH